MARRDRDERPPVELWQAGEPDPVPTQRVEVAAVSPSRRKALIGVAAALALLGAGLLLGGGSDDPEEGDEPSRAQEAPESTRRARPTTTRPATTTTRELFGQQLPEPVGAGLLLLRGEGATAVWLDLDTGDRREVELPSVWDPSNLVPVRGGVVAAAGPDGATFTALPGGETTEVAAGEVPYVMAGSEDAIWAFGWDPAGETRARLVALDGRVLVDGVNAADAVAGRGTQHGIPVSRGGWSYLATEGGLTPLGPGEVLDASADAVVIHACGPDGACELLFHDITTGEVGSFGDVDRDSVGFQAHLSPDGQLMFIQYWGGQFRPQEVRDRAGQVRWRDRSATSASSSPAWLPGGRGLILPMEDMSGAAGSGRLVWFADGVDASPQPIRAMVGVDYYKVLLVTR